MIIFGTKSVTREVEGGVRERHMCARCDSLSELVEHTTRQYVTLYFLPIVPIGAAERMLRCTRCQTSYHMSARGNRPSPEGGTHGSTDHDTDMLHCPYCQQRLRVPPNSSGPVTLRCPACRGEFTIERNRS